MHHYDILTMKFLTTLYIAVLLLSFCSISSASTWVTDFNKALTEAKQDSKPIFVDVYAEWCTWCHKLDKEVYSDPKFTEYMKNYVLARIDSEDGAQGTNVAQKYDVDSLPTMIVLSPQGKILDRITGFMTTPKLIEELEYVRKLLDAEAKNSTNVDASFVLAGAYIERQMYHEAEERYKRILESQLSSSVQKEKAQFSVGLAEYYQGNLKDALAVLNQYYSSYPNGASGEDALLLLSQIHIEMNSNRKALEYLREFVKRYPKSGNSVRAKQVLTALEQECSDC
ncbi:MAG TPA: thioredoxin family protein, partial [Acidobacteriota bacterium]